jgi:hypothetical protein
MPACDGQGQGFDGFVFPFMDEVIPVDPHALGVLQKGIGNPTSSGQPLEEIDRGCVGRMVAQNCLAPDSNSANRRMK